MRLITWDYVCPSCEHKETMTVEREEQDTQECSICQHHTDRRPSATTSWTNDPERKAVQMKKRSKDHFRRCVKKGIPLDANDSGISSDAEWRNKTRAKNTSPSTLNQHRYDHVGWTKKEGK